MSDNPKPGPHDSSGNRECFNPATMKDQPSVNPLEVGRKVFESTRESTDAPSSEPKQGAAMQEGH